MNAQFFIAGLMEFLDQGDNVEVAASLLLGEIIEKWGNEEWLELENDYLNME